MHKEITLQVHQQDQYNDITRQIRQRYGEFHFVGMSSPQVVRFIDSIAADERGYKTVKLTINTLEQAHEYVDPHELPSQRPIHGLFTTAQALLDRKAHDYASCDDPHSNFRYSERVSEPFPAQYKPYAVLIGTKLARLSQLLDGREAKNESILDSVVDLINYCALLGERYMLDKHERGTHDP